MPSWDNIFQFVTTALLAWVTYKSHTNGKQGQDNATAINQVHLSVNSRMDQLIEATRRLAESTGIATGRKQMSDEQKKDEPKRDELKRDELKR